MKLTFTYSAAAKVIAAAIFSLSSFAQGATWTSDTPPSLTSGRALRNFWGTSATNVYAVGGGTSTPGLFYRWDGTSWTEPAPTEFSTFAMRGIFGFSATEVWVAGRSGNARQSTNSGTSWTNRSTGLTSTFTAYGMWGASNTDIWVVGSETSTLLAAAYRWNGSIWSPVSLPGTLPAQLQAVWGTAANNVVMVGLNGYVARWNGSSLNTETSGTANPLTGVWGLDANNIYAVGSNATVQRYDGTNWTPFNTTGLVATLPLNGISGSSTSNLYVATGDGPNHMYHWDGATWTRENTGFSNSMNAVWTTSTGSKILAGGSAQLIAGAASVSSAPTVTTATQSAVTHNSATLGGNVTADGGASVTERGIVWGLALNPTTANTKVANGFGTGTFSATVNSLPSNTTIHVRAYATNSVDTSYGADISFTTLPAPVAVTSLNRVNATPTNASTVNWTLTFASAVTGLTASNFSLTGAASTGSVVGTPTITSGGGLTWNIPVTTGSTDGTLTLNLANATGLSATISTSLPFAGQSYTMDKTPPSVLSVVRQNPTAQTTSASSVVFRVTYSEPVTLTAPEASRFSIVPVNGGTVTGTIAGVTGSGNTRDVTVNITGGSGEFRLRVAD